AGHAAEAYARTSGKIGVAVGTVGPGGTNLYSAVHQANLSNSPMLVLLAGHEAGHDGMNTLQECYAEKLFAPTSKLAKRLLRNGTYKFWIRKAVDTAMRNPKGPTVLEFELEAMVGRRDDSAYYKENWLKQAIAEPMADITSISRAVEMIYTAEKPVLFVGDGVMWSKASQELVEFAQLAQVPVMGRRGGRGAIPEDHPLAFKTASVIDESDLMVLIGARLDFYDFWGDRWKVGKTIQVNDNPENIHPWLDTELAIPVNAKVFLQQMIDYIKANGIEPPAERATWVNGVQGVERKRRDHQDGNAERFIDRAPIHGLYLSKVIGQTMNDLYKNEVYVVMDGFTGSNLLSPYVNAQFTGQVLDSGAQAGCGHGVGMAIGAALGGKKPVLAMMGDAGIGLAGLEVETAARYNLPIVYVVFNNDVWLGNTDFMYGKKNEYLHEQEQEIRTNYFLKDIRYDTIFEQVGCHGEWVEKPESIRSALERAFAATAQGKPAVVNVDCNSEPLQAIMDSPIVALMVSHVAWSECTNLMKKHRRKHMPYQFPWDEHGIEQEPYDRYERLPDDYDIKG
ncbi:MAG: thiamine pyrophosphate-binding protein, partial [Bacillota bacterium]